MQTSNVQVIMHRNRNYRKYNVNPLCLTSSPSSSVRRRCQPNLKRRWDLGAVSYLVGLGLTETFPGDPHSKHEMAGKATAPEPNNKLETEAEQALDTAANRVDDLPLAEWMYCRLRQA